MELLSMLFYGIVGFLCIWYSFVGIFAFAQELGVGWKVHDRKYRMLLFIFIMQWQGTVLQFIVYAYHLVYGEREGRQFGHRCMSSFYGWLGPLLFGPFEAEGVENLPSDPNELCIYVSNHQSSLDFALYYTLPRSHFQGLCAVAKESIMFMPGFGAMTALCGGIMIRRGKKGTMQQCVEQATDRLGNGINVGLFPQGTRSVPSEKKPPLDFKRGFAVMAANTKVRIVPLTFLYAEDFLSAKRDTSKPAAKVIVHPPVAAPSEDDDAATEAVRAAVQATVLAPILKQLKESSGSGDSSEPKKSK